MFSKLSVHTHFCTTSPRLCSPSTLTSGRPRPPAACRACIKWQERLVEPLPVERLFREKCCLIIITITSSDEFHPQRQITCIFSLSPNWSRVRDYRATESELRTTIGCYRLRGCGNALLLWGCQGAHSQCVCLLPFLALLLGSTVWLLESSACAAPTNRHGGVGSSTRSPLCYYTASPLRMIVSTEL